MLEKLTSKLQKSQNSAGQGSANEDRLGESIPVADQQSTVSSATSSDGNVAEKERTKASHHTPFSSKPVTYPYKDRDGRPLADPYGKWGVEQPAAGPEKIGRTPDDVPPDHPVHAMSAEKQEKLEQKGVNPVLKAEMDHMFKGDGKERKGLGGYLARKMATAGWGTPGVDGGGM